MESLRIDHAGIVFARRTLSARRMGANQIDPSVAYGYVVGGAIQDGPANFQIHATTIVVFGLCSLYRKRMTAIISVPHPGVS